MWVFKTSLMHSKRHNRNPTRRIGSLIDLYIPMCYVEDRKLVENFVFAIAGESELADQDT